MIRARLILAMGSSLEFASPVKPRLTPLDTGWSPIDIVAVILSVVCAYVAESSWRSTGLPFFIYGCFNGALLLSPILPDGRDWLFSIDVGCNSFELYAIRCIAFSVVLGFVCRFAAKLRYAQQDARARRWLTQPTCTTCGYLLYGLPEPRCPECGPPFDPKNFGSPQMPQ